MRRKHPTNEVPLNCRITKTDLAKLRQLEAAYDVPISSVIRTLIRQASIPTVEQLVK